MGLKMTLSKEKNCLYHDFVDAYWAISEVGYSTNACEFLLQAYPSRDAKLMHNVPLEDPSIGYGAPVKEVVDSVLYIWNGIFPIVDIFPQGIPLDENAQKTAIYNFIKAYTKLPFEDVIEN